MAGLQVIILYYLNNQNLMNLNYMYLNLLIEFLFLLFLKGLKDNLPLMKIKLNYGLNLKTLKTEKIELTCIIKFVDVVANVIIPFCLFIVIVNT